MLPKQAGLSIDGEVVMTVTAAEAAKVRSVKVVCGDTSLVVDKALPTGATLNDDFVAAVAELDTSVPCLLLIRLQPVDGDSCAPEASSSEWALISWAPDEAPVRQRMLCASSKKAVMQALAEVEFKEYQATDKSEVTLAAFTESTRERTDKDRRDAMTLQEQAEEDAKKAMLKEQEAAPMRMPGLAPMKVKANDSFTESFKSMLSNSQAAVLAKLAGDKGEELVGEVLEGIVSPSSLKGKLPSDIPCYVFCLAGEDILALSWLPDSCPAKARMKFSTFKGSVMDLVKAASNSKEILSAECTEDDDLADDLGTKSKARGNAEPASGACAGGKPAGWRPPGAMPLPGMGPGGGMPLPGMRK